MDGGRQECDRGWGWLSDWLVRCQREWTLIESDSSLIGGLILTRYSHLTPLLPLYFFLLATVSCLPKEEAQSGVLDSRVANAQNCYSDGYQPYNYSQRLTQSRPAWVMKHEEALTKIVSQTGSNLVPLLTGYRGVVDGLSQLSEVSFKTCSQIESASVANNVRLLSSLADYFNSVNRADAAVGSQKLRVSFYPKRNLTVVSTHARDGDIEFDSPTTRFSGVVDFITHHNQALDAWQKASVSRILPNEKIDSRARGFA